MVELLSKKALTIKNVSDIVYSEEDFLSKSDENP